MAEHTKGKLTFNGYGNAPQWYTLDTEEECIVQGVIKEADARRLVACWNACEGISTETLENRSLVLIGDVHLDDEETDLCKPT